ncbi:serine hydrolase [Pseudorhodoferax sp. Leaf274]|uniref:serine hydrolase n=1 Tax=Pseudorhodoferax sp. Leaf274 TaxID=1736318 RepID=UPI00070322F2|nr:serine hydrolase [Pseudorhodoferax sp. Leaf274]KQP45079.1 serine hydrolase [Pseudorhodoferax sp. Leaf274]
MRRAVLSACLLLAALAPLDGARADDWRARLRAEIERLDRDSPGSLGVYVKRLRDGSTLDYGAGQSWYLGSTAKVPIAVAVLQQVDAGRLQLQTEVALQETDKIDGSGPLVWNKVGASYRIETLLTRMLGESDNTAANMLVRVVGADVLNRSAADAFGAGRVGELTDFTQVRREVYTRLHPDASRLTHRQLVEVAAAPMPQRAEAVRRALDLPAGALRADIDTAYAGYYADGHNSATLVGYGAMLERLVRGELLSPASTERLFEAMKYGKRGDYRLEAGLPAQRRLIHKTGTQFERACHMGVVEPQDKGAHAVVLAVCAAGLDEQRAAGRLFEQVGAAIGRALPPP